MVDVPRLIEDINRIFLNQIKDLDKVNINDIVNIILEKKQDGEKN